MINVLVRLDIAYAANTSVISVKLRQYPWLDMISPYHPQKYNIILQMGPNSQNIWECRSLTLQCVTHCNMIIENNIKLVQGWTRGMYKDTSATYLVSNDEVRNGSLQFSKIA